MKQLIVINLVFLSVWTQAQTISGIVLDEKQVPIPFASVSLLQSNDSAFVTGAITDTDGQFHLATMTEERILKVSYVGYAVQYLQPRQGMTITLVPESMTIGDVVVTGARPVYKMKGSALVAPVENTVLSQLGDAKDVLEQLPLLTKSGDDLNVAGRGKPFIYINNRLIRDPQELQEIKSNTIKDIKIELNPNARYSSEVGAVIRIKTIAPTGEGMGGNILSSYSYTNHGNISEQANLNYRQKGLDVFFNGTYNYVQFEQDLSENYQFNYNNMPITTHSNGGRKSNRHPDIRLTTGANYNISEKQLTGVRYSYQKLWNNHIFTDYLDQYATGGTISVYNIRQVYEMDLRNHNINAFYQNEISKKWQLNIDATYVTNKSHSDANTTEGRPDAPAEVSTKNKTDSKLWALKAWSTNQWLGGAMEWGLETTNTHNAQGYMMLNEEVAQYIPSTESESRQRTHSLFATYSYQWKDWNASLGLRYEYIDFDYDINGKRSDEVSKTYRNLFPSFNISYNHNGYYANLSYRTIVERPSYWELRSETLYNKSYSAERGNPTLQPAYTHRMALTFMHRDWILDATYDAIKDAKHFYTLPIESRALAITSFINHDIRKYNATLAYSPTIGIWKPLVEVGMVGQILSADGKSFNDISLRYLWRNILALPKQWTITLYLSGRSAKQESFIYRKSVFFSSLRVQKKLGQWQLTAGLIDLFNTSRDRWSLTTNGVAYDLWSNPHERGFLIRVSYIFNPAKSKYKGGQAGQSEMKRL